MKTIPGVEIVVCLDGFKLPVPVKENGYLGCFSGKHKYCIQVIAVDEEIVPVCVDQHNNISLMPPRINSGRLQYIHDLRIFSSLDGVPTTKYPNNHIRLVKLADDGKLNIWTVAVISQNGEFFLSVEDMFSGQCYWEGGSDGRLACPDLSWPQMIDFLNNEYDVAYMIFPSMSDYKRPVTAPEVLLEPGMAQVLWFNAARGFGALRTPKGNARVHWSQVEKRNGLSYLETGDLVSYEKLQLPIDTTQNKTSFKLEAVGVKPTTIIEDDADIVVTAVEE